MYPELLNITLPEFLKTLLGIEKISVFSYAFCIVSGILIASIYTSWYAKKTLGKIIPVSFYFVLFIAGFIGGKLFLFFENPLYYIENTRSFSNLYTGGFVFYGSFICIVPTIIWYSKKNQLPLVRLLDILAFTTIIVHAIGRLGCFLAGCCYGKPTLHFFGTTFTSSPNVQVHPTQLYEITVLVCIFFLLKWIELRQQFKGQLFLTYIICYAIARIILEFFRGDPRGQIVSNSLSHSQLFAVLLIIITSIIYKKMHQRNLLIKTN